MTNHHKSGCWRQTNVTTFGGRGWAHFNASAAGRRNPSYATGSEFFSWLKPMVGDLPAPWRTEITVECGRIDSCTQLSHYSYTVTRTWCSSLQRQIRGRTAGQGTHPHKSFASHIANVSVSLLLHFKLHFRFPVELLLPSSVACLVSDQWASASPPPISKSWICPCTLN